MSCTCAMPLPSIEPAPKAKHSPECLSRLSRSCSCEKSCETCHHHGVAHQRGERAAIIEFDAHQDRDAAEHQAVLDLRAAIFREGQGRD
jgi:hypothetical protein